MGTGIDILPSAQQKEIHEYQKYNYSSHIGCESKERIETKK